VFIEWRKQKKKKTLAFKGQETYSFVDGMLTDKVTTFNYIVHIGCEGRYLGITGGGGEKKGS
jgi:hypothetical protein